MLTTSHDAVAAAAVAALPAVLLHRLRRRLSQVADVPGFDFARGYTAFQFVFVLLQSAAFGGVFTGFGIARDFESGFARRLLLASPKRSGIVLGYALAALAGGAISRHA
jgi:ABC-2 type transport system permease protein